MQFAMLVLAACLVAVQVTAALDASLNDEWTWFVKTYNKRYANQEEADIRREIWEDNVAFIRSHNLLFDMGHKTFTVGLNMYADWSFSEYRKYLLGFKGNDNSQKSENLFFYPRERYESLPDTVDWRKKGYVTPVKNQGQCGSCWAFSSTGSLEGQHFKKSGQLVSLSEQNLVDCTKKYGNGGCHGGWMNNAFTYVSDNKGLDTEQSYPYEAKDDNCRYNPDTSGATDSGHVDITKDDEQALKAAVATVGPIAVAIDASHRSFQLYKSGLYEEPACSNKSTDHAVLAVGYGHMPSDSKHYWLVKNSWSTTWGMEGYIMMARDKGNMCAIASYASYPRV